MSLALKPLKPKDDINLFTSVVYHISFCTFLTLLVIRNAAIAINILIYVLGNTLSSITKQLIMIATERSASIAKSCLVLVEFLAVSYIKYIDFDDSSKQKVQKVSPEQNSIKSILSNASKRVQVQSRVSPINASRTPVVSPEMLKKSEAARSRSIPTMPPSNKPTEASTALSSFYSELSLKNAEKERLPLEQRYRPSVSSSLGKNRSNGRQVSGGCLSKRYSTLASEKPKRTITMKLINSTAANRASKRSKKYQDDDDDEEEEKSAKQQKSSRQKPEIKDKNLNLFDERPAVTQPPRTLHLNKPPEIHLQASRRYLKVMMRVRKHRNTI